jgi:hypothetical protein
MSLDQVSRVCTALREVLEGLQPMAEVRHGV